MSNWIANVGASLISVFVTAPAGAQSAEYIDFTTLQPERFTPSAISANGAVVVGARASGVFDPPQAARWSQAEGVTALGTLPASAPGMVVRSAASAVNANGAVIVGQAVFAQNVGVAERAFRWTQGTGMVSLGVLNGGSYSTAQGVSADGMVIVGSAADGAAQGNTRAFRWTEGTGMVGLGVLNGGSGASFATAASADGSVIVGAADDGQAARAFRWTLSTGMASLGSPNGLGSFASSVSADGAVIAGQYELPEIRTGRHLSSGPIQNRQAFLWTAAGGMESLANLQGLRHSTAAAVSADGTVVVGTVGGVQVSDPYYAYRWTRAKGMQTIAEWLAESGVTIPQFSESQASGTNADGSIVVGNSRGLNSGFIARVSPVGSGLITLADVEQSLASGATAGAMLLSTLGTVINGAHSRPLARRVSPGKNAFWVAGDVGRDDHGSRDGNVGLAEVGIGRNFGPAQVNVSVGQSRARQDLAFSGRAKTDGTYVLMQALIPVYRSVTATLGAYGGWGESEVRRGYVNGAAADFSSGSPDMTLFGFRARVDWENAVNLAGASLTPYVDVTRSRTKLDGYTESGGGFPARFDAREDTATELRVGTAATWPVSSNTQLVGMLEGAHRFEKSGARTTGNLIGLFGFDLPGARYDRDWLRVGAGIEARVAGGTASLMLNATTRGSAPSYWASAGWQLAF